MNTKCIEWFFFQRMRFLAGPSHPWLQIVVVSQDKANTELKLSVVIDYT